VCGTVFIAAGMAQTPWIPVAGQAMRLGLGLYLVPLAFVANPALIDLQAQPLWAALALAKVGLGLWMLGTALADGLARPGRFLGFALAGLALIFLFGVV
ncbi:MAG: TRAP transporter permease DctM/Q, partial [Kiloniellales bacterium]|nr:TRAP transporter permease DctM/Q [Kiloniellales bacterium]